MPDDAADIDDEADEGAATEIDPGSEVLDLDEEAVSTDPVRAYLTEIGRTPLLDAAEEVELAKRIEAGLYADDRLRQLRDENALPEQLERDLITIVKQGRRPRRTCFAPTCAWSSPSPRSTAIAACRSWTSCKKGIWA